MDGVGTFGTESETAVSFMLTIGRSASLAGNGQRADPATKTASVGWRPARRSLDLNVLDVGRD